jgi:hypothetical protein
MPALVDPGPGFSLRGPVPINRRRSFRNHWHCRVPLTVTVRVPVAAAPSESTTV